MVLLRLACWVTLIVVGLLSAPGAAAEPPRRVLVAPIQDAINPPLAEFVIRVIDRAESEGATAVVLEMDTPGGLDSSMRDINRRILASRVPVVVFVAPPGARAASAGVYIAYAAHVSAMAPNTNIGSATPVALGQGGEQQMSDEMKAKVQNDAVAYIRGLAEQRGRSADWAEKAVREGANVTARQAAEMKVVDLVAPSLSALLAEIDGRQVQTGQGEVRLATAGAAVERVDMNPVESLLHLISNPSIAYILLSLGSLAIFLELSNPGSVLPGVVGGICLLLAFYALGSLPVNYAGLGLILFAFLLFLADVFAATHGILTTGGVIAFVLGSLLLFNLPDAGPFFSLSLSVIAAVTLTLAAFFVFIVGALVRARQWKVKTGREGLVGQLGYARTQLEPEGMVFVDGELWRGVSMDGSVAVAGSVEVVKVHGLSLFVRPSAVAVPAAKEWLEGRKRESNGPEQKPEVVNAEQSAEPRA